MVRELVAELAADQAIQAGKAFGLARAIEEVFEHARGRLAVEPIAELADRFQAGGYRQAEAELIARAHRRAQATTTQIAPTIAAPSTSMSKSGEPVRVTQIDPGRSAMVAADRH